MKKLFYLLLIIFSIINIGCTKKEKPNLDRKKVSEVKKEQKKQKTETKLEINYYKNISKKKNIGNIKGLYLTTYMLQNDLFDELIEKADSAGINTIVFDIKNMKGELFLPGSQKTILNEENIKMNLDIAGVVKKLHGRDMKAVARVVMFHNQHLAENKPEYRPESREGGKWIESKRRKPSWLDPSNIDVQQRLYKLIEFVCKNGIDEIQLDYIRFPTQGNLNDAVFNFQKINSEKAEKDSLYRNLTKEDIIASVVKNVDDICDRYDVDVGGDLFAITAWQQKRDVENTGQNIEKLSQYFDYIHPMIYSSHFNKNFGYRDDIYNEPYLIVYWATKLTKDKCRNTCKVVPYIQANNWKVNFTKEYIISQIEASEEASGEGFILWNSENNYWKVLDWIIEK